jgi:hypothetical protein
MGRIKGEIIFAGGEEATLAREGAIAERWIRTGHGAEMTTDRLNALLRLQPKNRLRRGGAG